MKLGVLALVASVGAVIAPAALATPDQHRRSAQVNSLDVDPATVIAGDSTHVSVTLRNPADDASPKRDLLIRLAAPSLVNAQRNLARAPIGSIPAGGRKTIDLDVAIPGSVLGGEYPLVACRAQRKSPNKCGQSKQETTLSVLTPAGLALSPATHDFGAHATGTTSPVQTFTLTNNGDAPSGVPAIAVSGDAAQFPLSANTCTAALAGGESCSFGVAFAPTSTGAKSAGVGVVAVPGGGASATLSGTGLAPANLTIAAASKDFGTHATGTTPPAQTFTVTNTGGAPSGSITTGLTGANSDQFTKSADNCNGQTLAPGASCTVDGAFAPTSVGAKAANLQVSAAPGGTTSAALSGTGATPANLTISPNPHGFGTHATATTSPAQTFTVTNTGGVPSGTIATTVNGADPGQFAKSADSCNGQTLAPGASCTVDGAFAPTSVGAKAANLQASATPGGTASSSLTGTGATPANLTILPSPKDFGTLVNNTTSPAQTFTVTNTGGVPTGSIATSLTGASPGEFAQSADNCIGQTLGAGASCTVDAAFAPTSLGTKTAGLQASATPGGSATASLTGESVNPATLEISPATKSFGNVLSATTSPAQTFTVTNTGGVASGTIATSLAGTDPGQFTKSADNCNTVTLGPGASCTVGAAFTPTSTGAKSASLEATAGPGGTASAALTGSGAATAANLQIGISSGSGVTPTYGSSASRNVGDLPGGAGSTVYVWIKNSGAADAVISNSPVPINRANAEAELFGPGFATCSVSGGLNATSIPFSNLVIAGGTSCYFPLRATAAGLGAFSIDFTITGSPGGSITATITGTRSS